MKQIRAICVNDADKPKEIPSEKWPVKGRMYHITWILNQIGQPGVLKGCELKEFDISMHAPYNCYRLDRFAVPLSDLEALFELMKRCTSMNDDAINSALDCLIKVDEEALELAD